MQSTKLLIMVELIVMQPCNDIMEQVVVITVLHAVNTTSHVPVGTAGYFIIGGGEWCRVLSERRHKGR